jgi:anthranilate synthase component 1
LYYPDEKKFKTLSKKGNLIPVWREILADLETPVSAFIKLGQGKFSYLLESVEKGEQLGRYSFLGSDPVLVFKSKGERIEIIRQGKSEILRVEKDPLDALKKIMAGYKTVNSAKLPRFSGGAVGYVGYDMVRFWEEIPENNQDDLNLPDSPFMLSHTLIIFDHLNHKIKVVSYALLDGKESSQIAYEKAKHEIDGVIRKLRQAYEKAKREIDGVIRKLRQPSPSLLHRERKEKKKEIANEKIESNFTSDIFQSKVKKAKEYIRAGDIFQVVLSQRLKRKVNASAFDIYRTLRSLNPSPYMYYLKCGDFEIVGSSPETLVRMEEEEITYRPIAGTRKRGKDGVEDELLAEELSVDPKERAEHIMLVDLGRNDMGRVCEYGTVKVTELFSVEKYSHVMHLVSNVQGKLRKGMDQYDLLKACFPAGTVSGAPKVRAMEIIEELEPCRRGPYAGALGYFGFSGNMDTCIIIRTILIKDNIAYIQAGAGIVADSEPESEYEETLNKARALIKAIEIAEKGIE